MGGESLPLTQKSRYEFQKANRIIEKYGKISEVDK
jgi:hypothetical protein